MPGPVCEGHEGRKAIEMPAGRRKIGRLYRIAAKEMQAVETLSKAQEIAEVGEVAFATAALEIMGKRRTCHRAEGDPVAADRNRSFRVPGMEREFRRCVGDGLSHERPREAHPFGGAVHVGACVCQNVERPVMKEFDADLFENAQRPVLDEGKFVPGDRFQRREAVDHLAPGELVKSGPLAARTPAGS